MEHPTDDNMKHINIIIIINVAINITETQHHEKRDKRASSQTRAMREVTTEKGVNQENRDSIPYSQTKLRGQVQAHEKINL